MGIILEDTQRKQMISRKVRIAESLLKKDNIVPNSNNSDTVKLLYWCSDNLRQLLIQNGPQQVASHDFHRDTKDGLSPIHHKRRLANAEEVCSEQFNLKICFILFLL